MLGFQFSQYQNPEDTRSDFERLLDIFEQLLTYTSGDVAEALDWMNQLDNEHNLTNDEYGMGDFIRDLYENGYITDNPNQPGTMQITAKSERSIRKRSLDEIFGKLKKSGRGNHSTKSTGIGDEPTSDKRQYIFGDNLDQIDMTDSMRNAQIEHGIDSFKMTERDLEVHEKEHKSQMSTVLMIDISHSMILYGEDRITPAKKVAMALSELITTRYPKDTLDILVFGNDAWPINIKDLPYLKVGPYHTNTVAGLQLAMNLLRKRKNANKQIFMITDGKPSCLKIGKKYYKNSFGLDRKIVNRCLHLAAACKKLKIPITTFMIAKDPYLQRFVQDFTLANKGKAYYSSLKGLGEYIFEDFEKNRRKKVR